MTLTMSTNIHTEGDVEFDVHALEESKYDAIIIKQPDGYPSATIFIKDRETAEKLFDAAAELAMNFRERRPLWEKRKHAKYNAMLEKELKKR